MLLKLTCKMSVHVPFQPDNFYIFPFTDLIFVYKNSVNM